MSLVIQLLTLLGRGASALVNLVGLANFCLLYAAFCALFVCFCTLGFSTVLTFLGGVVIFVLGHLFNSVVSH